MNAGVPISTISRIETEAADVTSGMLQRLAAAAGFVLEISSTRVPTIADAARVAGDREGDWTLLRSAVDWATHHPEMAAAVISPCPATIDPRALAFLAAVAETIADETGLPTPRWALNAPYLTEPWYVSGTPRMVQDNIDRTPPRLARRNVWFAREAIWR